MVYNIENLKFRGKARFVAEDHMTEAPATIMYARVVTRETVRIVMIAALNDIQVKSADMQNAYVKAPVWTMFGPEFGSDTGKMAMIVDACMD